MVSTCRIEVFGVKPDLHFSFVINSFHNDLFSQGIQRGLLYFRKRHSCIFGRDKLGQEAPRRHPGAQGASEGIFLINHHHSHAKRKKLHRLVISLCVFDSEVTKHCKLLCKMLTRSDDAARYRSRTL